MIINIKRPRIDVFIKRFKEGFNKQALEDAFTNGNCYHFAVILSELYDEGDIVYDEIDGHFMFRYKDKYYDITGEVTNVNNARSLLAISYDDEPLYGRLLRDCAYKGDVADGEDI